MLQTVKGANWRSDSMSSFATTTWGDGGIVCHMVVEQIPDQDEWDWTVWRKGDADSMARHGTAPSRALAMRDAEAATWSWGIARPPGE